MNEMLLKRTPASSNLWRLGIGLVAARCLLGFAFRLVPRLHADSALGVVSKGTLDHLDSRQNYLYFLVGLLLFSLSTLLSLTLFRTADTVEPEPAAVEPKRKPGLALSLRYYLGDGLFTAAERLPQTLERLTSLTWLWVTLGVAIGVSWAINAEFIDLSTRIKYVFHDGEYVGFAASILQSGKPFSSTFFIHGFGINALPELLAHWCGFGSNGIAATRLFRSIESSLTWLTGGWLILEMVRSLHGKRQTAFWSCMAAVLFFMMTNSFYELSLRRLISFMQLALLIAGLRRISRDGLKGKALILPLAIGFTLPLGTLYDYSEALCFAAVYGLSSLLVLLWGRASALRWGLASLAGALVAGGLMVAVFGVSELKALAAQIGYWAHYGRLIWFIPLEDGQLAHSKLYHEMLLAPALAIAYLFIQRQRHGGWVPALKHGYVILVLLLAALLGDRVGLDRGLEEHLGWSGVNSFLLLLGLGLSVVAGERGEGKYLTPGRAVVLGLAVLLGLRGAHASAKDLNPVLAVEHVNDYSDAFWTEDRDVAPYTYQEALAGMGPEIAKAKSFYTLTSEGNWYHYFNKPSSSRFHQLTYARSRFGQETVIRDLEAARPEFILMSKDVQVDGLSADLGNPLVYRYVLEHYRPYRRYNIYWFWKRSDRSIWDAPSPLGPVDGGITQQVAQPSGLSSVGGEVARPSWLQKGQALRLYVTSEPGHRLLSCEEFPAPEGLTRVPWSAAVPTGFLGNGSHELALWLYDVEHDGLVRVGRAPAA